MTVVENDEVYKANEELNEWPADIYERFPLPACLTESLSETARKVNADSEAGRVIDGDTFLAKMRERARRAASSYVGKDSERATRTV